MHQDAISTAAKPSHQYRDGTSGEDTPAFDAPATSSETPKTTQAARPHRDRINRRKSAVLEWSIAARTSSGHPVTTHGHGID